MNRFLSFSRVLRVSVFSALFIAFGLASAQVYPQSYQQQLAQAKHRALTDTLFESNIPSVQASLNKYKSLLALSSTDATTVGTIPGKLKITSTGQATYTMPINVVPGTAGMTPKLSIVYNSGNHADGLMGMGFSLQGLSAITRVPSNYSQNGVIHGVDYTSADKFALNGNQLVVVNGKPYGSDGAEYRTYNDTYAKIISHSVNGVPQSFTVQTKGGQTATYTGYNKAANGASTEYLVTKIKDTSGNYESINYGNNGQGLYYPSSIVYTGNDISNLAPYNKVEFIYGSRTDIRTYYHAGEKTVMDQRLMAIKVFAEGDYTKPVYEYDLNYDYSSNTFRSRLTSIQETAGSLVLPPTKFCWSNHIIGWHKATYAEPSELEYEGNNYTQPRGTLIDLSGDGLPEALTSYSGYNDGSYSGDHMESLYMNSGQGWDSKINNKYLLSQNDSAFFMYAHGGPIQVGRFIDVNGNGLSDYVKSFRHYQGKTQNIVLLNTGKDWRPAAYQAPNYLVYLGNIEPQTRSAMVDLNGDGLPDFIRSYRPGEAEAYLNNRSGWVPNTPYVLTGLNSLFFLYTAVGSIQLGRFIDVNGDGLLDYVSSFSQDGNHNNQVLLNTGSGWKPALYPINNHLVTVESGATYKQGTMADLSGDGLPDIIISHKNSNKNEDEDRLINTGSGWIEGPSSSYLPFPLYYQDIGDKLTSQACNLIDMNGDGLLDYVCDFNIDGYGKNQTIWLNKNGTSWQEISNVLPPRYILRGSGHRNNSRGRFQDINGDGFPDFIYKYRNHYGDHANEVYLSNGTMPDYLIGITNGLGEQTTIDYEPISGADIKAQTKGEFYQQEFNKDGTLDSYYPNPQFDAPMYVVYQTKSTLASNYAPTMNDDGGWHTTIYGYKGARMNKLGLGFLGFHYVTTTDNKTGLKVVTEYEQDPATHYQNHPVTSITYAPDGKTKLSETDNHWTARPLAGEDTFYSQQTIPAINSIPEDITTMQTKYPWLNKIYYQTYLDTSVKKTYALNGGELLNTKTTAINGMDVYGDVTDTTITVQDNINNKTFTTRTQNTYQNNPDKWYLGELTDAKVTMSATGQKDITRESSFEYDSDTGLLSKTITYPTDPINRIEKDFSRNQFGEIYQTTIKPTLVEHWPLRIESVKYDSRGQFITDKYDAMNNHTQMIYTAPKGSNGIDGALFGKPNVVIAPNGVQKYIEYDALGRTIKTWTKSAAGRLGNTTVVTYSWYHPEVIKQLAAIEPGLQELSEAVPDAVYSATTETYYTPSTDPGTSNIDYRIMVAPPATKVYDQLNRQVAETTIGFSHLDPSGNPIYQTIYKTTQYDALGRPVKESALHFDNDPKYDTIMRYDALGRVTQTDYVNPDKATRATHPTISSYIHYAGYKTTTVDTLGHSTSKTVDARGKVIQAVDAAGNQTHYTYDPYGNLITMTDSQNNTTTIKYDPYGAKKVGMSDPDKGDWTYKRNALGQLTSQTDAKGQTTQFTYDILGRMISRTTPAGIQSTWTYDNNPTITVNGKKQPNPALGKLSQVQGVADGSALTLIKAEGDAQANYARNYTYNDFGQPLTTTVIINGDANPVNTGYRTTLSYDIAGRVSQTDYSVYHITDPKHGIGEWQTIAKSANGYDAQGYLYKTYNPDHPAQLYQAVTGMNVRGKATEIRYGNGLVTQKQYNPVNGYLTDIVTTQSPALHLQNEILPALGKAVYQSKFGEAGNSAGAQVHPTDLPKQTATLGDDVVQSLHYDYDDLGEVMTRNNAVTNVNSTFTYDNLNRLTKWNYTMPLPTSLQGKVKNGNLQNDIRLTQNTGIYRNNPNHDKYTINQNPLNAAQPTINLTRTYAYDALGNMVNKSDLGSYQYDTKKDHIRPHAVQNIVGVVNGIPKVLESFQYDEDGNQTSVTQNGKAVRTVSYTSYQKPLSVTTGNETTQYFYNADHTRFLRKDTDGKGNTTTTLFLGGLKVINHQPGANSKNKAETDYKITLSGNVMYEVGSNGKSEYYYLLRDSIGSVTAISNQIGQIVTRNRYTPFGERIKMTYSTDRNGKVINKKFQGVVTHQGFTGHEEIEKQHLIHANGRLYDPILGRFLSADPTIQAPYKSQSLNRYTYCMNNPLALTDPSGYSWWSHLWHHVKHFFHAVGHAIQSFFANKWVRMAIGAILGAVASVFMGPIGLELFSAVYKAGVDLIEGSGIGAAFKDGMWSLASSELSGTIGDGSILAWGGNVLAHGLVGGGMQVAEGGRFKNGFLAGAIQSMVPIQKIKFSGEQFASIMARTVAAGIVGGAAAAAGGGNFVNGAESGAFSQLFHDAIRAAEKDYNSYELVARTRASFPNRFSSQEALRVSMGPNAFVIGIRPLGIGPFQGHYSFDTNFLAAHDLGLYHMNVFMTDGQDRLTNYDYSPNGILPDENLSEKMSSYRFSNAFYIGPHTVFVPHGFKGSDYNLIFHNCQDYSSAMRRRYLGY